MAHLTPYPESIAAVISAVDHHLLLLLSSPVSRRSLQHRCTSKLQIPSTGFFEFPDHSILSNLYWGIETIECAVNARSANDRNALLANSEKMLQFPAMLDEDAATAGIDNRYIVCCSYFHLALIRKLWSDEWQMAMHFFQAVLVSPSCVRAELAPELYASLFDSLENNGGGEEEARRLARKSKECLMFYQVISYGESKNNQFKTISSNRFLETDEQESTSEIIKCVMKASQIDRYSDIGGKNTVFIVPNSVECESTKFDDKRSNENFDTNNTDNFDIRRLQEMLEESQSDSSVSIHSDSTEATDSEAGTKCIGQFTEAAIGVLLDSVVLGENPSMQSLSAFILCNMGGTFSWTGESYTAAWILKRAGLTASFHRNMVRKIDWLDPCLQDSEMCPWSTMAMKILLKFGRSVFCALAKGIQSQRQSVQRDCLITTSLLGIEMEAIQSGSLRYYACEILLNEVAAFLHPGTQLDERVLACLSVYYYTSGKGKLKLLNFSEGLRESLRRLSGVTWMAEELLNVTNYVLPIKPRVSCVHTQILEIVSIGNGSATALIFYKGYLYTGYSDGSIKVWDIKDQRSVLLWEVKMHKRSVTCFTVYEAADSLLSGSSDKTVRVWKNFQKKFECIEVIQVKESVQRVGACNEKILIVTQSGGLKVCHSSRSFQTVCKNKRVASFAVFKGKVYLGCTDSSMQEIDMEEGNEVEIKAPSTSWKIQKKPINSICVYKGWIYCAGASVDGSNAKDWRRRKQPQISIKMSRGNEVQTMSVSEDFFYLTSSSYPNTVQICLREKQHNVGRLSAGSKVTSLLTANDIILCGTEAGHVKGWIPL